MVKESFRQTGGTVQRWRDRHVWVFFSFQQVIKSQVVSDEGEGLGAGVISVWKLEFFRRHIQWQSVIRSAAIRHKQLEEIHFKLSDASVPLPLSVSESVGKVLYQKKKIPSSSTHQSQKLWYMSNLKDGGRGGALLLFSFLFFSFLTGAETKATAGGWCVLCIAKKKKKKKL